MFLRLAVLVSALVVVVGGWALTAGPLQARPRSGQALEIRITAAPGSCRTGSPVLQVKWFIDTGEAADVVVKVSSAEGDLLVDERSGVMGRVESQQRIQALLGELQVMVEVSTADGDVLRLDQGFELPPGPCVQASNRLFVGNLSWQSTE